MFRFHCKSCGQWHEGMPTIAAEAPLFYYGTPEDEREARCRLGTNTCVVDDEHCFIRGCLEIPVHGETDPFIQGVWVSLSKANFDRFMACFEDEKRSHIGPFFGRLSAALLGYPDTENLKTHAHLRDGGIRPFIELEPTDHPLSVEQRNGITADRVAKDDCMLPDAHPTLSPLASDQPALSGLIGELLDDDDRDAAVTAVVPSMDLRDLALQRRLVEDGDFVLGEAVGIAIEKRPAAELREIVDLCLRHRHPQVVNAGRRAAAALERLG